MFLDGHFIASIVLTRNNVQVSFLVLQAPCTSTTVLIDFAATVRTCFEINIIFSIRGLPCMQQLQMAIRT